MKEIAFSLPGINPGGGSQVVNGFPSLTNNTLAQGSIGDIASFVLNLVLTAAGMIAFIVAFIGVFQYITAGGNKEGLAKARSRIMWALIGLVFIMIAFAVSAFIRQVIPDQPT